MKRILLIISIVFIPFWAIAQTFKPYTIGVVNEKPVSEMKSAVASALQANNFNLVGEYMPAEDKARWILIVTHDELLKAAEKEGGLRGFAATLRIAITKEEGKTIVSYTSPEYWGRAYYQDSFDNVSKNYEAVSFDFIDMMSTLGSYDGSLFGSEKGLDANDLLKYHYMLGMPYFDDTEELEDFDSQAEAIKKIEANLKAGVANVKQVYKVEIANGDMVLYGFALGGEDGESKFLPIIDIGTPKHTAFLPYELLVVDGEVHILHGRFRIAIAFPDLTMGTFTKIMSTPGEIEETLEAVVD